MPRRGRQLLKQPHGSARTLQVGFFVLSQMIVFNCYSNAREEKYYAEGTIFTAGHHRRGDK